MFRELDAEKITETLDRLILRIEERFPDSGLFRVARDLLDFARESHRRIEQLRRPHWPTRVAGGSVILLILGLALAVVLNFRVPLGLDRLGELLQALDAAVNEFILLALAIFFLGSLEGRYKRRVALGALHELRSIAHVIDMHQLTKDPEALLTPGMSTRSSPRRSMTRFELSRYLDYCSELLSMTSKLAALHVQHFRDPVVLGAVNDVEELADGLSQKIWQKVLVLETGLASRPSDQYGDPLPGGGAKAPAAE